MLRNVADFVRGLVFGLVVGGSAGVLLAPAPGDETQSVLEERLEAARQAFHEGRAQAEKDLVDYFEETKQPASGGGTTTGW
ncbi:MAG: hypothetical protein MAG451_02938 [Anaerolineales bacterium]|nr:hypothetical protein [Anaerolineales bacterium]